MTLNIFKRKYGNQSIIRITLGLNKEQQLLEKTRNLSKMQEKSVKIIKKQVNQRNFLLC